MKDGHKYGNFMENDVNMFDKSFDSLCKEGQRKFIPIELDFKAKTSLFRKKLKEVRKHPSVSNQLRKGKYDGFHFPVYSIFKDYSVNEVIVDSLIDLIFPKSITMDNKENSHVAVNDNSNSKLKSSSKLKKSIQKPVVKEEEPKLTVERKDKISLRLKILSALMINLLSTSGKPIIKALNLIEDQLSEHGDEIFKETWDLLFEFNALPYIIVNLLSEDLVTHSMNVLVELVLNCKDSTRLYEKLLDPSLFEIIKLVTKKYCHKRNIFNELSIILQRIASYDSIKMKEY